MEAVNIKVMSVKEEEIFVLAKMWLVFFHRNGNLF